MTVLCFGTGLTGTSPGSITCGSVALAGMVMCPPPGSGEVIHLKHIGQYLAQGKCSLNDYKWQSTDSNPGLSQRFFLIAPPKRWDHMSRKPRKERGARHEVPAVARAWAPSAAEWMNREEEREVARRSPHPPSGSHSLQAGRLAWQTCWRFNLL